MASLRSADQRDQRPLVHARDLADGRDADVAQFPRGDRPDAPQALDLERMQEPSSSSGGTSSSPSGFATPLATFARNFVRAMPTVIGRPTSLDAAAKRARDLERRADASLHAAHIEERLVDRERLDHRCGVVEDAEDGLRASEYASNRAGTTTACGHSCRAAPLPIAVRTPNAFAS